jgi:hypothetical protein
VDYRRIGWDDNSICTSRITWHCVGSTDSM